MSHPSQMTAQFFPVSVIVRHEPVQGNRWIDERWTITGVVAGAGFGGGEKRVLRAAPEGSDYLWPGFGLRLYRSQAGSYYLNLVGQMPSVYVVGRRNDAGELIPILATVEYMEANGYGEAGEEIFAVPMPPEVYIWVEAFVLEHYEPEEKKPKRKRHPDAAPPDPEHAA